MGVWDSSVGVFLEKGMLSIFENLVFFFSVFGRSINTSISICLFFSFLSFLFFLLSFGFGLVLLDTRGGFLRSKFLSACRLRRFTSSCLSRSDYVICCQCCIFCMDLHACKQRKLLQEFIYLSPLSLHPGAAVIRYLNFFLSRRILFVDSFYQNLVSS